MLLVMLFVNVDASNELNADFVVRGDCCLRIRHAVIMTPPPFTARH